MVLAIVPLYVKAPFTVAFELTARVFVAIPPATVTLLLLVDVTITVSLCSEVALVNEFVVIPPSTVAFPAMLIFLPANMDPFNPRPPDNTQQPLVVDTLSVDESTVKVLEMLADDIVPVAVTLKVATVHVSPMARLPEIEDGCVLTTLSPFPEMVVVARFVAPETFIDPRTLQFLLIVHPPAIRTLVFDVDVTFRPVVFTLALVMFPPINIFLATEQPPDKINAPVPTLLLSTTLVNVTAFAQINAEVVKMEQLTDPLATMFLDTTTPPAIDKALSVVSAKKVIPEDTNRA